MKDEVSVGLLLTDDRRIFNQDHGSETVGFGFISGYINVPGIVHGDGVAGIVPMCWTVISLYPKLIAVAVVLIVTTSLSPFVPRRGVIL